MSFYDFFEEMDFVIDPDELYSREDDESHTWDSGIDPDIFSSGQKQDIFSTYTS